MSERPEIRSPFRLLDEVDEARELLVLTYTANLDFFERFSLGQARALGAVVTLVSDAAMVSADPVVVRRAGISYLDARAIAPGAFHPKLVVLVGEDEARVTVGSGNLTMAGWHGNAEMWTVLRANRDGGPETLGQVAGFLRRLRDSKVELGPGAPQALDRVAGRLDALPAVTRGPRLIDNLDRAIIEQLPEGPVDELLCCAPFHDPGLLGLTRLLDRFDPGSFTVYVQERGTSVDGPALERLVRDRHGELRWIADERYHHGKLVEWADGDRRWALSGSPNLSKSALLNSVAEEGNCELALLAEVAGSCSPAVGEPPAGSAATLSQDRSEFEPRPSVLLLAAIRTPDSVRLRVSRALEQEGRVQRYDEEGDGWRGIASLTAGAIEYVIEASAAPVGQSVRIVLSDGTTFSNAVFVTDLARACLPQARATGRVRSTPEEVATNGLGPQLLADLQELREHLLRVGALVPAGRRPGTEPEEPGDDRAEESAPPPARPAPGQTLEDYIAACDPVLGREMTEFALVLPALPGLGDVFDESEGLDTDQETDEGTDEHESGEAPAPAGLNETLRELGSDERARWRRWVERLVGLSTDYPMIVRTLALRSVLHGVAEGMWEREGWPPLLAQAAQALGAPGDEPTEDERAAAASLGAIALALQRTDVLRISVRDERTMRYVSVARAIAPLLPYVDSERVEQLAPDMPEPLTGFAAVEGSERVVREVLEPTSGAARAVQLLGEEDGIEAAAEDGAIRLLEPLPRHAEPRLFRALGLASHPGPVVARGRIENGNEIVAIWRAPYVVVERRGPHPWGRLYRLPDSLSPLNYSDLETELPRARTWMAGEDPPPEAAELLRVAAERR